MLLDTSIGRLLASCRIALALACLGMAGAHAAGEAEIVRHDAPKPLPALPYSDEHGHKREVDPDGYALTAVHFWATWCVPCVEELPEVDAVFTQYAPKGLQVVPLSLDGEAHRKKIEQFYANHRIKALFPYIDIDMAAFRAAMVRGLPTTLFLDKDGHEIARAEGVLDWGNQATRDFIESHLK